MKAPGVFARLALADATVVTALVAAHPAGGAPGGEDLAGLAPPSPLTPACSPVPLDTVIDQGGFTVSS